MSYHEYLKIIGNTPREDIPRVDFEADDPRFQGYASLYLHPETKRPMYLAWYLWNGSDDVGYLREKYAGMGHDISHLTSIYGGNGHYSLTEPDSK